MAMFDNSPVSANAVMPTMRQAVGQISDPQATVDYVTNRLAPFAEPGERGGVAMPSPELLAQKMNPQAILPMMAAAQKLPPEDPNKPIAKPDWWRPAYNDKDPDPELSIRALKGMALAKNLMSAHPTSASDMVRGALARDFTMQMNMANAKGDAKTADTYRAKLQGLINNNVGSLEYMQALQARQALPEIAD